MHRRRTGPGSYGLVAATLALSFGCGASPEQQILNDFFRASRMRDSVTLGNFATVEFDPSTDGVVQSFDIVSVGEERATPMPLSQYARAIQEARAADQAFNREKRAYQDANLAAIDRILQAESAGRTVAARDRAVKEAWDKWRGEAGHHLKAISDAQRQLSGSRGLAELSLARAQPPLEDVTQYDGERISKVVTLNATVRTPSGATEQRTLEATMMRVRLTPDDGDPVEGRWIVTGLNGSDAVEARQ